MMIIIGIDPGTILCGYGIIRAKRSTIHPLDYGCIRPPRKEKISRRYLIIFQSIEKLLEKYSPDALVVETQYVKRNVQSAIKLGMARGAVILAAAKRGVPIYEYPPTKAKIAVSGTGRASKKQMQYMVKQLLHLLDLPPEDAADALALAICHIHAMDKQWLKGVEV